MFTRKFWKKRSEQRALGMTRVLVGLACLLMAPRL